MSEIEYIEAGPETCEVETHNGQTVTLCDKDDVHSLFKEESGFQEGKQIEEFDIKGIDAVLNAITTEEKRTLVPEVFIYFEPVTNRDGAWTTIDKITVPMWIQTNIMVTSDGILGIKYERYTSFDTTKLERNEDVEQ
jgi:hypothetical protein